MSHVINAPTHQNTGGYENMVTTTANKDKTAGSNALSAAFAFEQRVTQETGTH